MTIRILQDVRLTHEGREFIHSPGQVLDSEHPLAPRFVELLNAGAAVAIAQVVETTTLQQAETAVIANVIPKNAKRQPKSGN